MPNRLVNETSPYLLQHAHNPVDWYPWGPEALAKAKADARPILLSVGYSACHWCHVMERESFEDPAIAERMNREFVNIKVDREERPDLDEIYMHAVQAFTGGRGGWPMTVFLTPDGVPYFGGTYFPPRAQNGMPSFLQVLDHGAHLWSRRREEVARTGARITEYLRSAGRLPRGTEVLSRDWLRRVADACAEDFGAENGGFGGAPKFPPHGQLAALAAFVHRTADNNARRMLLSTLDAMARGGVYDLLGGGFARYSVDAEWRVPHFEKMLYDNAQLVPVYLDAFRLAGAPAHARVARETLDWMLREMNEPEGAFHSSLDADSEGIEGRFYVWTPEELRLELGDADGTRAAAMLEVTQEGTFEDGASVLRLEAPPEALTEEEQAFWRRARRKLFEARERRVRPGRDDKVVTAWNALAISAFARGSAVLGEPRYAEAAIRSARFLLERMTTDGRLHRTWREGRAHIPAFADDHALFVQALLDLWEATFDARWVTAANEVADHLVHLFWDEAEGGLYYTGSDAEPLVVRSKHMLGGAEPAANAVAALAFARLDALCGREDLGAKADRILACYQPLLARAPRALGIEAIAAGWRTGSTLQIGIAGDNGLVAEVRRRYLPFAVVGRAGLPWMEGKSAHTATAWVCVDRTCLPPVHEPAELGATLERVTRPETPEPEASPPRLHAPALPDDASLWLNADRPLTALRGNVVVLDFWTYCCINCLHVLPELAALEEATLDEPVVVIGVHTAKFEAERDAANVRRAVRRHRIRHPVVLDAERRLWDAYAVRSWPTVVVVDPAGRIAWQHAGEVSRHELTTVVRRLLTEARDAGTLGEPAWVLPNPAPAGHGLHYPGKVHAWGSFVYVADTDNHRIVEAELGKGPDGWPVANVRRVFGGNGPGLEDGHEPRFRAPQGMARAGDTLWVADTENHALRAIDLRDGTVRTIAGTGRLGRGGSADPGQPRKVALRSPWDVAIAERGGEAEAVFIAMAGSHQVWVYLPDADRVGPMAGSGREDHVDGPSTEAALAQPSGLALLGGWLFFVDSETSSVRAVDLQEHRVGTLCGQGLFDFGDHDGHGAEVRMQHPLGVAAAERTVWVADTFNDKIKAIDLDTLEVRTVCGGSRDVLWEPGGITIHGDHLLVADTNNHRIRAVRRADGEVNDVPFRWEG